ncbi:hypothetical protein Fmac_017884 [Flemingia macrophylla]|uniref:ATP synthase F0 subunit 8 n=1 Tax=Flemingia macrophylla TaxID=520843 RepID=A0ABD1M427_9FABA
MGLHVSHALLNPLESLLVGDVHLFEMLPEVSNISLWLLLMLLLFSSFFFFSNLKIIKSKDKGRKPQNVSVSCLYNDVYAHEKFNIYAPRE